VAPSSIRWSTTQNKRWGSCTLQTGEIRISERLRVAPDWVLDAVIVHELAHLIEPNHSPRFRELESRYPRRHDADVFLDGYALGLHMPPGPSRVDAVGEVPVDSPVP
jgi:predicted metal-dependent hydrolase